MVQLLNIQVNEHTHVNVYIQERKQTILRSDLPKNIL